MASLRDRSEYLSAYSPGDVNELLRGSRYTNFASLPSTLGDLSGKPKTTYTSLIFDKLSPFESKADDNTSHFQRFLNLQRNPESLATAKMKVPTGFNQAYNLADNLG
tara:strand:+ start:182 stop:502 length:321 start_codon:yes stop_codon:yes gene_type:complete